MLEPLHNLLPNRLRSVYGFLWSPVMYLWLTAYTHALGLIYI